MCRDADLMDHLGHAHLQCDRVLLARHAFSARAPQPNALTDLFRRDWLAQEHIHAQARALCADLRTAECRKHKHRRHVPCRAQLFEQQHAVHSGQGQLRDEQIGPQLPDCGERLLAALRNAYQFHILCVLTQRRHLRAEISIAVRQKNTNFSNHVIHVINHFHTEYF